MGNYVNRTCSCCGIKRIQPYMVSMKVEVESGKSTSSMSGSTVLGALIGEKSSYRSIIRSIFNTSQRTYTRNVVKWYCQDCAEDVKKSLATKGETPTWVVVVIMTIAFIIWIVM